MTSALLNEQKIPTVTGEQWNFKEDLPEFQIQDPTDQEISYYLYNKMQNKNLSVIDGEKRDGMLLSIDYSKKNWELVNDKKILSLLKRLS